MDNTKVERESPAGAAVSSHCVRPPASWALCAGYIAFIAGNAFGQTCTATGVVVNALNGEPVPRVQITLPPKGASTDADGTFSIPGVPCGTMRLTVSRVGFLPKISPPVKAGPEIRLALTPEASISGRVTDQAGDPVDGAEIRLGQDEVNSDSAGNYRIGGLKSGRSRLCAHSSEELWPVGGGEPLQYAESCYDAAVTPGADIRQNFTLIAVRGVHVRGVLSGLPEGARAVIQIGLKRATFGPGGRFAIDRVAPGDYDLTGVADAGGRRVLASQHIQVGSADIDNLSLHFVPAVQVSGTVSQSVLQINLVPSDPDGDAGPVEWDDRKFTFPSVAPGVYRVRVAPPGGYYVKTVLAGRQDIGDREITIASPMFLEIALANDYGSISGSVAGGVADVLVVKGDRREFDVPTDATGSFTIRQVPPGEYKVYAFEDARGVNPTEAENPVVVTVVAGSTAEVKLTRDGAPN